MKTTALLAATPLVLALAACGDPIDGSDTADMSSEATTGETGVEDDGAMNPANDGMLDTDVETVEETMEEPMTDDATGDETQY